MLSPLHDDALTHGWLKDGAAGRGISWSGMRSAFSCSL
jgi:hypothetical protein